MKHVLRSLTLLIGLAGTGFAFSNAAVATTEKPELPSEWRDRRKPELRKLWDRLEGKAAPSLSALTDWHQTKARSWKDFKGKVVLIDMWATWCGPCIKGIPHLEEMHAKYADDGLVILGVHVARGKERMADWLKARQLPYSFAIDGDNVLSKALGIQSIPSYFVVDREGVMRIAGANRAKLDDIVKALLEEKPSDSSDAAAAPEGRSKWPLMIGKKMHATNDLRGHPAPKFEVEKWLTPEPNRAGKVLMVDFWATWCGPCRRSIPKLNQWHEKYKDDVVLVGLSNEPEKALLKYFGSSRAVQPSYPQAIDTNAKVKKVLGVQAIPHVMIVSTDGIVRWQGFPESKEDPLTEATLRKIIAADPGVQARRARDKQAAAR